MLNCKLSRSALSLILAILLVFSIFTVGVFAEDSVVSAETDEVTDGATADDTAAADDATEAEDGHDHDHEDETATEEKKEEDEPFLSTFDIVTIIIFAVLIIAGLIYCLKNREKVGKFLRSLRSEFKKISLVTTKCMNIGKAAQNKPMATHRTKYAHG